MAREHISEHDIIEIFTTDIYFFHPSHTPSVHHVLVYVEGGGGGKNLIFIVQVLSLATHTY